MRNHIEKENGKYIISNPVHPEENFADKWQQYPEREEKFFKWLDQLEADIKEIAEMRGLHNLGAKFGRMFGEQSASRAFEKLGVELKSQRDEGRLKMAAGTASLGTAGKVVVPRHNFHGEKDVS